MWLVVTVVAVVVLIATYLTWTAARVDRLHARAAAAYSALDAQSLRRAATAAEVGERCGLVELQTASRAVLAAPDEERTSAENDLTRALRSAADKSDEAGVIALEDQNRQLALARQVHTDLVRDAQAVRRRPVVRVMRMTRRHPMPAFFDIDEPTLEER
jgi:hypothetical protein